MLHISSLIRKIIFYRCRNFMLYLILFSISLFLVSSYIGYNSTDLVLKKSTGQRMYGSYDIRVLTKDENIADEILGLPEICNYEKAQVEVTDWNGSECYWYYANEGLLETTNFELTAGRFPEKNGEILCEDEFLSLQGYFFDRDGEVDIEIHGSTYHVTGSFRKNEELVTTNEVYCPTIISTPTETAGNTSICLYLDTGDYAPGDVESEILKTAAASEAEETEISMNAHYLSYVGIDKYGNSLSYWLSIQKMIACIIFVMVLYMLVQVARIFMKEKAHDFTVLLSMGITPGQVSGQYACVLGIAAVGNVLADILVNFVYFKISAGDIYSDVSFAKVAGRILIADGVFCMSAILAAILCIQRMLRGSISITLANSEKIHTKRRGKPKKIFEGETSLIPPLMENMMKMKRRTWSLFLVSIILGMMMTDIYSYSVREMFPKSYIEDYEYSVRYIYNSYTETVFGIDGMDETWENLEKSQLTDALPIFYTCVPLTFQTSDLEKKYRDYLEEAEPELAQELASEDGMVSVACAVLGVDRNIMEKLCGESASLSNTECYVISQMVKENGRTLPIGLEEGDEAVLTGYTYTEDEESCGMQERAVNLTVVGTSDELTIMEDIFYGMPVVLVNMSIYKMLADYDYPYTIYLNRTDGVSEEEITDYFRTLSNILLVDHAAEVEETKKTLYRTMLPVYFMEGCLIAALFVNVYVALSSSYGENRRQLAMLLALGISHRKLVSLQMGTNRRLFVRAIIWGNILSYGSCYLFYLLLIHYDTYAEFRPPAGSMMATTFMVTGVFMILSVWMDKKINRMDLIAELSGETT